MKDRKTSSSFPNLNHLKQPAVGGVFLLLFQLWRKERESLACCLSRGSESFPEITEGMGLTIRGAELGNGRPHTGKSFFPNATWLGAKLPMWHAGKEHQHPPHYGNLFDSN